MGLTDAIFESFDYPTIFGFSQVVAVHVQGSLTIWHTIWMFAIWFWFNTTWIDLVNFAMSASLFGVNLIIWIITAFKMENEMWRSIYFWTSFIANWTIFMVWPLVLIGYIIDASLNPTKWINITYIVVKILLFAFYNIIHGFLFFEVMWPIYSWWQVLA